MPDTRALPRIVVIEDDAVVAETLTLYLEHAASAIAIVAIAAVAFATRQGTRREFQRFQTLERRATQQLAVQTDRVMQALDDRCCTRRS